MISCTFENGTQANLRHVVVDVLVIKDQQILLEKREKSLVEGEKWAVVGGYVDCNESLLDAVVRETREETGYTVSNVQLLCIIDNPKRRHDDRQNITFVYICQADEKVGESDWEVTEQQWFHFTNLPSEENMAFDHLRMIETYLAYQKEKFALPIIISQ